MPQQRRTRTWFERAGVLALLVGLAVGLAPGRSVAQDAPPAVPAEEEPEVLTSGPVNEAFAAPVVVEDQGGVIAPSAPPEPVEEQPSADRPVGGQFAWIPGYWSWSQQRQAWVWVSGCWRAVPPGQSWVPGYWTQVSSGWEWVAGFWTPAGTQQLEYLSTPPPAFEVQPTVAAPGDDYTWVPGCYYWRSDRWVPRHGYWLRQVDGWCWTPSYLLRTPRGYVFCSGHWDYSLHRRGVLYAPVYMSRAGWGRHGFRLALGITIGLDDWDTDLFVCPGYSHYYYGDYYDSYYTGIGIYPFWRSESYHNYYDPLWAHARWRHRSDFNGWQHGLQQTYYQRRDNSWMRPSRTYREQQTRLARVPEGQRYQRSVGRPMSDVVRHQTSMRYERSTPDGQRFEVQRAQAVQGYRGDRRRWEGNTTPTYTPGSYRGGNTRPSDAPSHGTYYRQPDTHPREGQRTPPVNVRVPQSPVYDRGSGHGGGRTPSTPSGESRRGGGGGGSWRDDHGSSGGGGGRSSGGGGGGGGGRRGR